MVKTMTISVSIKDDIRITTLKSILLKLTTHFHSPGIGMMI